MKKDSLVAQNSSSCCCFFSSQEAWNSLIKNFVTDSVLSFPQVEKKKNKEQKKLIYPAVGSSSEFGFLPFFLWEKVWIEKC